MMCRELWSYNVRASLHLGDFCLLFPKNSTSVIERTPKRRQNVKRSYLCLVWRPEMLVDPRHVRAAGAPTWRKSAAESVSPCNNGVFAPKS